MHKITAYILLFLFAVAISSISQILLKISAMKSYKSKLYEYVNWYVIIAYGMFFSALLLNIMAYKYIPLSLGPVLESLGYIFVAVLGVLCLKEKIKAKKAIGLVIIMLGVLVFSLGEYL